ncbi:MAG: glycerol-3-phosphate 1-O-acyltransferase PlsY [Deltaproteobacteria bacterium]|nr:glycerol-3-phosphate 1-O-acyltransferase PlsY [Deltaproteobacteria bacterium]
MISKTVFLCLLSYLLGSIPWGVVLTRLFSDVDVTSQGSRNIGAFNVFRVAGKTLGLLTLAADVLKGAVPVLAATLWIGVPGWTGELLVCLVALSAFVGHLFPIFLGFKGGKGVATAAGCFMVISPFAFFISSLVYILVLCWTGYSSLGSLSAATILPGAIWLSSHSVPVTVCALTIAVAIYIRHAENIRNLLRGTEHSPLRPER